MPELPGKSNILTLTSLVTETNLFDLFEEVERAASLTREIAQDKVIQSVETTEDKLVYSGVMPEEFVRIIFVPNTFF